MKLEQEYLICDNKANIVIILGADNWLRGAMKSLLGFGKFPILIYLWLHGMYFY